MRHFNTDATEYAVVFTANATAAIKLVAETFDFGYETIGSFYYCQENHTSVLGMREIVQTPNQFVLTKGEILENLETLRSASPQTTFTSDSSKGNSLLAVSAQCNFSGYKIPLNVISNIQKAGLVNIGSQVAGSTVTTKVDSSNFYIFLDTASFVATNYLDLQKYQPDFLCLSFYKIFG